LTVYHMLAGKAALPKMVELEADRFQNLKYKEPEFQKEARAVLGEYNKSSSNPLQKMFETLHDNAFAKHTYKHTTIGFLKDIEDMPSQFAYSLSFFDRYYRPDNVTLVVVGDVVADEVFPLIETAYGDWKKGPARPAVPAEPAQLKEKRVGLTWKEATLPVLLEGWHAPGFSTSNVDLQALDVLSELLFSERAPLYKRLVIKEQKVQSLSGSNDLHVDPNLFSVTARIKKPEDLAYVEKAIDEELAKVAHEGVDEKTLQEVLSNVRYSFAGGLSTADRVATISAEYIALGGVLDVINRYHAQYPKVTSTDVQRVAKSIFKPENRTVVTLVAQDAKQGGK
jgi:zinc protease